MARETGFDVNFDIRAVSVEGVFINKELERFAALVAAAEREACAKVCEETTAAWTQYLYNEGCIDCAKAIRARGET
jgi:DNA-binding protein YbaB